METEEYKKAVNKYFELKKMIETLKYKGINIDHVPFGDKIHNICTDFVFKVPGE